MNTALLDGVAVFVEVARKGSFTAAADSLGHSTSWVSKEISRLEARLGVRLLNRTTRTLSLTDPGRAWLERCEQIVVDAENAIESITELQETPRGLLRINAPVSFGMRYLGGLLAGFMSWYPEVQLEVEYNDRYINVVEEGFDVVIRVGDSQDSSLVSRRITASRAVTVASPAYLDRFGRPQRASELKQHRCISYSLLANPNTWEFDNGFDRERVNVEPVVMCNTAELESELALKGVGITRLPQYCVDHLLQSGQLEVVLPDYRQPKLPVCAVYPHRQYLSTKVRAFVDFMVERFQKQESRQS